MWKKVDLWNLDQYLEEKWKLWFQDFNINENTYFHDSLCLNCPRIFMTQSVLRWCLIEILSWWLNTKACRWPVSFSGPPPIHLCPWNLSAATLYIPGTQWTVECHHEKRSFIPCCVLCLTGCLESHRCSTKVCPISNPFINMNINKLILWLINKYIGNMFKIVPGTHSMPS